MSAIVDNDLTALKKLPNHSSFFLRLANNQIKRFNQPSIMGVINMSPNSFYDPKKNVTEALFLVENMVDAGVDMIDIGGEATNPFVDLDMDSPNLQQELDRLLPLLQAIRQRFDVFISIDTSQPEVMRQAIANGADMINDQRALQVSNAMQVVSELNVPVCLMHFFQPTRQPGSSDCPALLQKIKNDLQNRITTCLENGILPDRIIVDPGFGQGNYGKNCAENFYLLAHLNELLEMGYPVLVGWSRKSMIGDILGGVPAADRLSGSIASASIAAFLGASIIRVHDVKETVDAMKIVNAVKYWSSHHEERAKRATS